MRPVGIAKAQELFGLGEVVDAPEALRIGLANRLSQGDLLGEAKNVARQYAALPPVAANVMKAVMAHGVDTLEQALASEIDHQPMLRMMKDHTEAVEAFLAKRQPRFTNS